jgi:hypothetical protein
MTLSHGIMNMTNPLQVALVLYVSAKVKLDVQISIYTAIAASHLRTFVDLTQSLVDINLKDGYRLRNSLSRYEMHNFEPLMEETLQALSEWFMPMEAGAVLLSRDQVATLQIIFLHREYDLIYVRELFPKFECRLTPLAWMRRTNVLPWFILFSAYWNKGLTEADYLALKLILQQPKP